MNQKLIALISLVSLSALAAQEHYYLPIADPNKDGLPSQTAEEKSSKASMDKANQPQRQITQITSQNAEVPFRDIDMVRFNGITFTIGEDSQTYPARRTLKPFLMNKYEVTYSLWHKVRIAAEKRGYVFGHLGQEGTNGRRGKLPTISGGKKPVTMISWYDAIVWCNALSEESSLSPCYTYKGAVLRDSTDTASCDLCECEWEKDGYRLPAEAEWEAAARYTPAGLKRGDRPSGEDGKGKTAAWTAENAKEVQTVGTALTVFGSSGVLTEAGSGIANGAGLFDMSGNVLEYCWDWFAEYGDDSSAHASGPKYGDERVSRGGSVSAYTSFIASGDRYAYDPNEYYNYMGFRLARSVAGGMQ